MNNEVALAAQLLRSPPGAWQQNPGTIQKSPVAKAAGALGWRSRMGTIATERSFHFTRLVKSCSLRTSQRRSSAAKAVGLSALWRFLMKAVL
jgi:hypothetical protein